MTTHTDLIARLREMAGRLRLEAADAIESLEQQVAALTKDKEQLAVHLAEVSSQSLLRIYAAQARESKLLAILSKHGIDENELV